MISTGYKSSIFARSQRPLRANALLSSCAAGPRKKKRRRQNFTAGYGVNTASLMLYALRTSRAGQGR